MSYKSTHTGAQIDAGVSAALNPDATPTLSSTNLVTSGGVAAKLSEKQDTLVFDNAPTSGSNNPVKSGGIYTALTDKASNADLALKAPLDSPVLTGTPTAPTPTAGDNSTKIPTTAFVRGEIATESAALSQVILASFPTDSITDAAIASFADGADGIPVKALTVNITPVQSGSGDPSPTNVRPISGWDAVRYIRSADAGIRPKVGTWTGATGSLVFDGKTFHRIFTATATALNLIPSGAVPEVLQGSAVSGRYYCHLNYSGTKSVTGIKFEFANSNGTDYVYIDNNAYGNVKSTFTFKRVFVASIEGGEFSAGDYFDLSDLVIAVEPDTASISLGQTVYGGTLTDNGDGTWTLKSKPYYASYNGETLVGPWISSEDVYAEGTTPTTGAQVVDLGGAETEYTLTADSVKTLLGQNNIWADTGDIASLTYRADVGLYIDKKLAEAANA